MTVRGAGGSRPFAESEGAFGTRMCILLAGLLAELAAIRPADATGAAGAAVAAGGLVLATCYGILVPPTAPRGRTGATPRTWFAAAVLLAVSTAAVSRVHPTDTNSLRVTVTVVLVATQIAQALVLRTARDAAVAGVLAAMLLLVAGVFATSAGVGWAILPGLVLLGVAAARLSAESWRSLADPEATARGTARSRTWRPVLAAALVGGLALLLAARATPLGTTAHFRAASGRNAPGSGPGQGNAATSAAGDRIDLLSRGNLPATPLFATDAAVPEYLEGAVYGRYDGRTWERASTSVDDPPLPNPSGGTRTDEVQVLHRAALTTFYGPGRIVGTHVQVSGRGVSYTVETTGPWASPPDRPPPAVRGRDLSDPSWLQLPSSLPQRVRDLAASLTSGSRERAVQVDAVETYLRTHEKYTLSAPVPPAGRDAVDDFLFTSHEGFCEQFVAADIVLLRASGIPARMVTGYAFGDLRTDPGKRVLRSSDAHAWVQVWYPGTGWVSSDPTAGAARAAADASSKPPLWQGVSRFLRNAAEDVGRAWQAVVAVVAAVSVLLLAARATLVRRRRRDARRRLPSPELAALQALDRVLAGIGQSRRSDESLRALGLRLRDPDLAAALSIVETAWYAPDGTVAAADRDAAVLVIRTWRPPAALLDEASISPVHEHVSVRPLA